jgi:hypothetical protein
MYTPQRLTRKDILKSRQRALEAIELIDDCNVNVEHYQKKTDPASKLKVIEYEAKREKCERIIASYKNQLISHATLDNYELLEDC